MTTAHDATTQLAGSIAAWPDGPILLALSGGLDSTALAHALAHDAAARARGVRAIHVDHGLAKDSADWRDHAARLCATLALPFVDARVTIDIAAVRGHGLEAAAREARYRAIAQAQRAGEIVVTAHHADDQAETLLLRLLRGAAPGGLAAMRAIRPLPPGFLARPWLALPRDAIRDYAARHALAWVDDPSNADERHLRNFLRHRVLAPLRQRVPNAAASLSRSASLLAAAEAELGRVAEAAIARAADAGDTSLDLATLATLSPFVRGVVLRRWCEARGVSAPDAPALREIDATLLDARVDAEAHVRWRGGGLRAWRGRAWPDATHDRGIDYAPIAWDTRAPLALPHGAGTLAIDGAAPLTLSLRVAPRAGGERIAVHPRRPRQSVRTALQAQGVPPWQRARAPYLWLGETLYAVGDWLVDHRFAQVLADHGARLRWTRPGAD